jgi:hypothetical protein
MLLDSKITIGFATLLLFVAINVNADAIHDPTLPKLSVVPSNNANSSAPKSAGAVLQGIVKKKNSRMAIISGQLTQIGDEVDGYKVSQINNNNVVLIKAGSQKRLYVYEK